MTPHNRSIGRTSEVEEAPPPVPPCAQTEADSGLAAMCDAALPSLYEGNPLPHVHARVRKYARF